MRLGRILFITCSATLAFAAEEPLFNGKDLTGWQMVGPGRFVIENGMMKTEGGMGLLWYTGRKIGNETVRVVFRTTGNRDNSGVIIRLTEPPTDAWYGVHNGFEVQIDAAGPDEWHQTGSIYSLSKAGKKAQKAVGEWNTMEIRMEGPLTRITLNGELVNEYRDGQQVPERKLWYEPVRGPRPDYGFIGLQNHDPGSNVYFREVTVITTDKSPLPMTRGERDRLLSSFNATRKQILDAVAGLSPAQWTYKPGAEKWSIAQVVEHLALTEDLMFGMAQGFLARPVAPPDTKSKPDAMVERIRDRSRPADAPAELRPTGRWQPGPELVNEFRSRRDRVIDWVNETKDPLLTAYGKWGSTVIDAYQALNGIPAHTERHLAQINEVKATAGYPKQ